MVAIDIPLGAIAYGKSGIGYRVVGMSDGVVTLEKPDKTRTKAKRSAIFRWEMPEPMPANVESAGTTPQVQESTHGEPHYPIGTRLLLRQWLEFLDGRKPKWWTIVSYRPENGIYSLDADDGHVACLDRKLIERDLVELQEPDPMGGDSPPAIADLNANLGKSSIKTKEGAVTALVKLKAIKL